MNRRNAISALLAGVATLKAKSDVGAQFTTQEVRNGLQVTSTGDVRVEQAASGNQAVEVFIDGQLRTMNLDNLQPGIYETRNGQMVVNDSQITSTGDVDVVQSASGDQRVTTVVRYPERGGDRADVCQPGAVMANPNTGQLFYQANDCCWYVACASDCQKTCQTCEGRGK